MSPSSGGIGAGDGRTNGLAEAGANAGTYGAGLLGYLFLSHALLVLPIGVGGLLIAPLWYAWLGVILLRKANRTS